MVVYAYGFLRTTYQAWIMAIVIAIVLGGSQALSRSLFFANDPEGSGILIFGIYEVSERGTSWMGPLLFSIVVAKNGFLPASAAFPDLLLCGGVGRTAYFTNTDRAVHEAGNLEPWEAAHELGINSRGFSRYAPPLVSQCTHESNKAEAPGPGAESHARPVSRFHKSHSAPVSRPPFADRTPPEFDVELAIVVAAPMIFL